MNKLVILLLVISAGSVMAADQLLFTDSFKDGSLKGGTKWSSSKPKQPWSIKDNYISPSGKIIFDTVSTKDFKPIENGNFTLKFSVKFNSPEKNGNNRFSVMMRDSANSYSGYGATIAQGTSNNSNIEKISSGKRSEILRMSSKNATFFVPGKAFEVVFALNNGILTFSIAGKVVMKVENAELKRFDCLQFQERCKTPEMTQAISDISLSTN